VQFNPRGCVGKIDGLLDRVSEGRPNGDDGDWQPAIRVVSYGNVTLRAYRLSDPMRATDQTKPFLEFIDVLRVAEQSTG
jgi:hypothetical protein